MSDRIAANRRFLTDLFTGPFHGHGLIMTPPPLPRPWPDDCAVSQRPVADWVPWTVENYERELLFHETIGDDSVPCVRLTTGTEVFPAAFGCPVHLFEDSNPAALPLVSDAAGADALPVPDLSCRPLERIMQWGQMVRERVGPDVPISVPDIQSPFDIAALIWQKDDFYLAMYTNPAAVKRLVDKCHSLLKAFLLEFKRLFPGCNLIHYPQFWAPPELGCSLSEDEAGCVNAAMFAEFCLPSLVDLSETFGGMFVHSCAAADHQYDNFNRIPRLRGMNRNFQAPGPVPAIEAFSGKTVLVQAMGEADIEMMLDLARPDTRYLFTHPGLPLEETQRTYEHLRRRCPRQ